VTAPTSPPGPVRVDKWLWAARFFKTRSLAAEAIAKHRIEVHGQGVKASRDLRIGDEVTLREPGAPPRVVTVLGLSGVRGPAPVAQLLYRDTPDSVIAREAARVARQQGVEPATAIEQGRPTKRDRRVLSDWQRWSASVDDEP
jgi:ribosome-associated heat shock protein Hsp15